MRGKTWKTMGTVWAFKDSCLVALQCRTSHLDHGCCSRRKCPGPTQSPAALGMHFLQPSWLNSIGPPPVTIGPPHTSSSPTCTAEVTDQQPPEARKGLEQLLSFSHKSEFIFCLNIRQIARVPEKDYILLCMLEMLLIMPWVRKANTELINETFMFHLQKF